jgi:hypothetical protein
MGCGGGGGGVVALTPHSLPLNKWKERKTHTMKRKMKGASVEFSLITFGHSLNQTENT